MLDNFGIMNMTTGEVVRTFDNPFDAVNFARLTQPEGFSDLRAVERSFENVYKLFPDGRSFIVDTKTVWNPLDL